MKPLIFGALAVAVLASAAFAQNAPKKPATTGNNTLAPVGTYANYAFSKDAASYQPGDPKYDELGAMPAGVDKVGKDYVVLKAGSSQTIFRAPFGWYSDEDGQNSKLFTPDQTTRFIMGFRDMGEKTNFARFKIETLAQVRAQMKEMKQTSVTVRGFDVAGGSYAVEVTGVTTESGAKNGFLQVFTPHPKKTRYIMSLSLTAPMKVFPKYRGLAGLILRDRVIIW